MGNMTVIKPEKINKTKIEHLDKRLAKVICQSIYYLGLSDCWYELNDKSKWVKLLYTVWCIISNTYIAGVVFAELAANFRTDLTVKERNDVVLFSMAHPPILIKFVTVYFKRNIIKVFFKKLIEETRCSFTAETEALAVKKAKIFITVLSASMVFCLSLTTIDGIKSHFEEGLPLRTLVTVYPPNEDLSIIANLCRVAVQFHWWYLVTIMIICDSLCLTALIFLEFKFRTLTLYFNSLRTNIVENVNGKTRREKEIEYAKAFVNGIKLHTSTLWCAANLQNALGSIYSVQVLQSITLLSMCLIKLVRLERSFTFLLANGAFALCVLTLTGTYMVAAGDITHAASLVPMAIFHSGWERCSTGADLKPLLVLTLRSSQEPVIMTAFGIFGLSYGTFISILRSSYSFFAVMY